MIKRISLFLLVAVSASCSLKDDIERKLNNEVSKLQGKALASFAFEPPVAFVTPGSLITITVSAAPSFSPPATDATSATAITVATIKERFFTKGPTYILGLLSDLDGRVAFYETGSTQSVHKCIEDPLMAFEMTAPTDTATVDLGFPHHLNCRDAFPNGDMWVAFGKKDDTFYLRQGMASGNGYVGKVDKDGRVEAWLIVADKDHPDDMSVSLMHLAASKPDGILEFSVMGNNIGVGCGVQYRSNAAHLYLKGRFTDMAGCAEPAGAVCLDAATLTAVDASVCLAAGLDQFTLPAIDRSFVDYRQVHKIATVIPTGVRLFAEGATGATP